VAKLVSTGAGSIDRAQTLNLVTFPARAATVALGVLGALAIRLAVTGIFRPANYTASRWARRAIRCYVPR
jgi:hypothetical protein